MSFACCNKMSKVECSVVNMFLFHCSHATVGTCKETNKFIELSPDDTQNRFNHILPTNWEGQQQLDCRLLCVRT